MQFQTPLIRATLVRRYKRFLADVILPDGSEVTAHCANPGAMTGLKDEGTQIWVEPNDNPKRKLNYSWKLVCLEGGNHVCIDTAMPNAVVEEALRAGQVPELSGYDTLKREVTYGQNSRIDFFLTGHGKPDTYVEVKSVTLRRNGGLAEFPDSVTKRGTKHLNELSDMVRLGHRAVMLYVVHRTDCTKVSIAADIDPDYASACDQACADGVQMLCYGTVISPDGVSLAGSLPFEA